MTIVQFKEAAAGAIALLALSAVVTSAKAEFFYCPSPEAPSFQMSIDAPSADLALKRAQAGWSIKYLAPATACYSREQYAARMSETASDAREAPPSKQPDDRQAAASACSGMPRGADVARYAQAKWLITEASNGCAETMGALDQLFVAGAASRLAELCRVGASDRPGTEAFLTVEQMAFNSGLTEQFLAGFAGVQPSSVYGGAKPFGDGIAFADSQGGKVCASGLPRKWFTGLARYLADTANDPHSGFVDTCVIAYQDSQPREKCACIAETMRATQPDIHRRLFSQALMDEGYKVVGLGSLMLACGLPKLVPAPVRSSVATARGNRARECNNKRSWGPGTKRPDDVKLYVSRCMAAP